MGREARVKKKTREPRRPAAGRPWTGPRPPPRTSQERAFNRWLSEQLRRKYDPVLDESIPEEILDLLRRDRERQ